MSNEIPNFQPAATIYLYMWHDSNQGVEFKFRQLWMKHRELSLYSPQGVKKIAQNTENVNRKNSLIVVLILFEAFG